MTGVSGTGAGRVALVTGAARGIGLSAARLFLEEGWRVALLDIDGPAQEAAVAEIARPDDTLALTGDVADRRPSRRRWRPSRPGSAASTRWSTMPAPRCSSRSSTPPRPSGPGCSPST